MIERPPEYQITCNCGIRISGTNEKGTISLVKKHLDTSEFHAAYLSTSNLSPGSGLETSINKIMLDREKNNANTTG